MLHAGVGPNVTDIMRRLATERRDVGVDRSGLFWPVTAVRAQNMPSWLRRYCLGDPKT